MSLEKKRIWELDVFRGVCILAMVLVHIPINLSFMTDLDVYVPKWLEVLTQYGHLFFVLLSGVCVTLASSSLKRGTIVFLCGTAVSYVTLFAEYILDIHGIKIWFGTLHMLGLCMIIYPLFKKMPAWLMAICGAVIIGLGVWFTTFSVDVDFLFPLGLCSHRINLGSDYIPMLPGFGWFLMGAVIGKTVYRKKETLMPKVNVENPLVKFFSACGRNSLLIYLLHQPIITALVLIFVH